MFAALRNQELTVSILQTGEMKRKHEGAHLAGCEKNLTVSKEEIPLSSAMIQMTFQQAFPFPLILRWVDHLSPKRRYSTTRPPRYSLFPIATWL